MAMAISMTVSTLNPHPILKPPQIPLKSHKFPNPFPQFTTTKSFNSTLTHAFPSKKFGNSLFNTRNNNNNNDTLGLRFCLNSLKNGQATGGESEAEIKDFSQSSLPERFRYTPSWNPWIYVASLSLLIYSRKIIECEVRNWRKWASIVISFLSDKLKFVLIPEAIPVIRVIQSILYIIDATLFRIKQTIYSVGYLYRGIIASAPIGDLTWIIILASIILAIAETAVPDSMNSQPYIMTIAGVAGYAAVKGFITGAFFGTVVMGSFIYSRFIKKKDYVSSSLPGAAVLAAVGEPWVQVLVVVSFSALAISHHWKNPSQEKEGEANSMGNSLPFPLVCAGLAIGLRVAAKWAYHRHLIWLIV